MSVYIIEALIAQKGKRAPLTCLLFTAFTLRAYFQVITLSTHFSKKTGAAVFAHQQLQTEQHLTFLSSCKATICWMCSGSRESLRAPPYLSRVYCPLWVAFRCIPILQIGHLPAPTSLFLSQSPKLAQTWQLCFFTSCLLFQSLESDFYPIGPLELLCPDCQWPPCC